MSIYPVQSNPESMLETLYLEQRPRAMRYAKWLLRNDSDAEEVVQEAFLRLAGYPPRSVQNAVAKQDQGNRQPGVKTDRADDDEACRTKSHFIGRLFTTVRNLSIDRLRRKGRRKDVALDSVAEPAGKVDRDSAADQLKQKIDSLMTALPDNWAEALKLKISGDLTYDEIAQVLNCTRAQVRTWIFRARRQLANELAKQGWLENKI